MRIRRGESRLPSGGRGRVVRRTALASLGLVLVLLAACRTLPDPSPACIGAVGRLPAAVRQVEDPELLRQAVGAMNRGGLCEGVVVEVGPEPTEPITVYRIWDSARPESELGRWWSLEPPLGTRRDYRVDYDICPGWSQLDRLVVCQLRPGARIAVGPGQGVTCPSGASYPPSPVNQIYVPNDSGTGEVWVEACEPSVPWP